MRAAVPCTFMPPEETNQFFCIETLQLVMDAMQLSYACVYPCLMSRLCSSNKGVPACKTSKTVGTNHKAQPQSMLLRIYIYIYIYIHRMLASRHKGSFIAVGSGGPSIILEPLPAAEDWLWVTPEIAYKGQRGTAPQGVAALRVGHLSRCITQNAYACAPPHCYVF